MPIQNTMDINGNNHPDFFTFGNSDLYRSIHIYDVTPEGLSQIWTFTLNENQNGYIADAIISDFDGDGKNEILAAIELENQPGKFYLFPFDGENFSPDPAYKFPYPDRQNNIMLAKMVPIDWDNNGNNEIAMVMRSPNRSAMVCQINNGSFNVMEKIAHSFVKNTYGLLSMASADFDGDNIDDLIIINNGLEPTSFQYLSKSSPKLVDLNTEGPILFIAQPNDINGDNIDDLLLLTRKGQLFSTIWGESIALDHNNNYRHIFTNMNPISGLLNIFALSQNGDIQKFELNQNNTLIAMDAYYPKFFTEDVINPEILYINNGQEALVFHNGESPEISDLELEPFIDYSKQVRSDGREANIVIKSELLYQHPIEKIEDFNFSEFKTDSLPSGMEFNLDSFALDWAPTPNQLGFHELNYHTAYNTKGKLLINKEAGTVVTPTSTDTSLSNSYLLYVNDPPFFANNNPINFLIVNNDTLDIDFSIKDRNVDAIIHVGVNTSQTVKYFYDNPVISSNTHPGETNTDTTNLETAIKDEEIENDNLEPETTNNDDDAKTNESVASDDKSPKENANTTESEQEPTSESEKTGTNLEEESNSLESEIAKDDDPTEANEIKPDNKLEDVYSEIKRRESKFLWAPNVEPGVYRFTLWVNDLHDSDSLNISVRVHPQIHLHNNETDFVLTVGKPFEYKINVTQKNRNNQPYNFSIRNAPENMYIDSTGSIFWVPIINQVNNHDIIIDVDDGTASASITLTLFVNDPPIISKRPPQNLILDKTSIWEYKLISFDANITADITWELLNAPHTMTLDSAGNLRWMVNEVDHWDYSVKISDGIDSTQFTNSIYSNYLPQITSTPIKSILWVDKYNYQINVKDDNQLSPSNKDLPNLLTYSFDKSPLTMSISDSGLVAWQPLQSDEGAHQIIINVNDGLVDVKQEYNLLVEGPPTITIADSLAISAGDTLELLLTYKNFKNTQNLEYSVDGLPKSLQINDSTGAIKWISNMQDVGLFNFTANIKNERESAEKLLKLFVYQYPELNLKAPTEAYVGLRYIYDLQAFDMFGEYVEKNNGEIRIEADSMPNIKFDSDTHTIQWLPSENDLGEHEFTVEVIDQFGLTTTVTHYVSVFMSPCELCKSAKRKPKPVKQVLTPIFKKDTPDKITGNASSIQVNPLDSLTIPQDSLNLPIDTLDAKLDSTMIPIDPIQIDPLDSLTIPQDSPTLPIDTLDAKLDSTIIPTESEKMDSLIIPISTDSTIIDTSIE
jgi:hypothetical protein